MSLPVKDGGGNNVTLVSTLIGGEHAVHHVMLGSSDGGTTMRVLKTTTDGTVVMSGVVTVTGGATSALQDAANASLNSLDGGLSDLNAKVPAAATLADNTANPTLSAIASYTMVFDGTNWDRWDRSVTMTGVGLPGDSAAASDTESTGLVGLTKRLLQRITAIIGVLPGSLGQANSAGSFPVVIANNQSAVPVTGTFFQGTQPVSLASLPALATGSNTIGTVNLGTIGTAATAANQTTTNNSIGATGETVAASDTATAGLNGLFKRLLQRITTLLGVLPGSLGSKTSANSFPVVVASDQGAVPVSGSVTVSGTVTASGPLTDGQLRATPVPGIASIDSASLYNGTTAMTPKFATIAESTSGDRTIIAAVTGKKIRVLAFRIKAATASSAAVSYYWRGRAGGQP